MKDAAPSVTRLADYQPPDFTTTDVDLVVEIGDGATVVRSTLSVRRQHGSDTPLELDGEHMELLELRVNGEDWLADDNAVERSDSGLKLHGVPDAASVEIVNRIEPEKNKALEGLYHSGSMYCTQCEAQGFRRITYYQDRPDVLARFTTTIVADGVRYPTALSNGNCVADETTDDGRRRVTWQDPFPKPSYLFALVCGDLAMIEDRFTTMSGRDVTLQIFSEPHNIGQCDFAMDALKRSMRWDEEVFGREYDLDIFMVVAVEDFNMGAMENKGLNIFNTAALLASPDTATDATYERVEAIVAHEYFHNWSGNRVTCRDWFQLSLKEGFTVFRDAEFTADTHSRAVKRIEDVTFLRSIQFVEDAGPMAHPIRPDSYIEISNFYTPTVYEKGAEVVRMLHTLVGPEAFRRGSDLYFDRHDGSAATTEDFVVAMEEASGLDLGKFRLWYSQAGTPVLTVGEQYSDGALTLTIEAQCPPTAGQPTKAPMHIPLLLGLVGAQAAAVSGNARYEPRSHDGDSSLLVHLCEPTTTLVFEGLASQPDVSMLRGFSAPVRLDYPRSTEVLARLVANDTDGFARWDVLQTLIVDSVRAMTDGGDVPTALVDAFAALIAQAEKATEPEDRLMLARLLAMPSEPYLLDQLPGVRVEAVVAARDALRNTLAAAFADRWLGLHAALADHTPYAADAASTARRSLLSAAFSFVGLLPEGGELARAHYAAADNLTDRQMAMAVALDIGAGNHAGAAGAADSMLADFIERFGQEALCVDTWLRLQATSPSRGDIATLDALEASDAFDATNPNKIRALYGAFAMANVRHFHAADGSGYRWLAARVLDVDGRNPQMAARIANPLIQWRRYDDGRARQLKACLREMVDATGLSPDVYELVSKSLEGA